MSKPRIASMSIMVASLGLAVAALVVAPAATGVATTTFAASFPDPAGDVQGLGPDITSVAVSDVASAGVVTVTVNVAGFSGQLTDDSYRVVRVYLDTDRNVATGAPDQDGAEYGLGGAWDVAGSHWWIDRWDGNRYLNIPQTAGMSFARSGDTLTWTFNKTDIGGASGFALFAWASTWDPNDNQTGEDVLPDSGSFLYSLATPPTPAPAPKAPQGLTLKPVVSAPTIIPARPVAGKTFTVILQVTRNDTGAALTTGKMICDPSVNGKVLPHTESFKGGLAKLSFAIPKTAKGKQLAVKVTIKVGAQSTTRVATFRIA
jgi:hypothetical protein